MRHVPKVAYFHGEKTALDTFGLTKEALAPLAALAPAIGAGAMTLGRAALPWLARGAASLGRGVMAQLPGAAAQTGAAMAADKFMQPRPAAGPASGPMPGMLGQGHLPGMAM